jgi:hypothetical protein
VLFRSGTGPSAFSRISDGSFHGNYYIAKNIGVYSGVFALLQRKGKNICGFIFTEIEIIQLLYCHIVDEGNANFLRPAIKMFEKKLNSAAKFLLFDFK